MKITKLKRLHLTLNFARLVSKMERLIDACTRKSNASFQARLHAPRQIVTRNFFYKGYRAT